MLPLWDAEPREYDLVCSIGIEFGTYQRAATHGRAYLTRGWTGESVAIKVCYAFSQEETGTGQGTIVGASDTMASERPAWGIAA